MRPVHIEAMLQTHPSLLGYSARQLQRNSQFLMQELQLLTPQLRSLLFQMPSLLGMSIMALEQRVHFWKFQVFGLQPSSSKGEAKDVSEMLGKIVRKQPSLLQYSVPNNLQPKMDFFVETMKLNHTQLQAMTKTHPRLWGRSLEKHWIPMTHGLAGKMCSDDSGEAMLGQVGQCIIVRAPEVFLYHWKHNVEPKVDCLLDTYGSRLTRHILLQTPRVLCQSLERSLMQKMELVHNAVVMSLDINGEGSFDFETRQDDVLNFVKNMLYETPSLLSLSKATLAKRLNSAVFESSKDTSLLPTLPESQKQQQSTHPHSIVSKKVDRTILLVDFSGNLIQEFMSVSEAAIHANRSTSSMYYTLRRASFRARKRAIQQQQDNTKDSHLYLWSDQASLPSQIVERYGTEENGKDGDEASSKPRRGSKIICLNPNGIHVQEFGSVKEAAIHANVSISNMYYVLRKANSGGWRRRGDDAVGQYTYAWLDQLETGSRSADSDNNILSSMSRQSTTPLKNTVSKDSPSREDAVQEFTIQTAGRAYPPEGVLRGRRRSGGMAFSVAKFSKDDWRNVVSSIWKGQKLQLLRRGESLILGYNYLRPSRPRCGLYAIREALRVARVYCQEDFELQQETAEQADSPELPMVSKYKYKITVMTDSNYCLDLLENSTQIMEWGKWENKELFLKNFEFDNDQSKQQLHTTSPDILYPLSRLYFRLRNKMDGDFEVTSIEFVKETRGRLGEAAQLAAELMYDSVK